MVSKLWQESFATSRGGERRKSPTLQESNALYASLQESNALYAFRVWSKCDCLGEYDSRKCDTPKRKEIAKILDFYKFDRMIAMW
jgi:hypothetical protein